MTDIAKASQMDPIQTAFYNAPYLPDDGYERRSALQQACQGTADKDKPVAIYGEAGTGKTHAAVHLAYDFCAQAKDNKKETFVLWFNAKSVHSILTSFHTIALQLGLPVIDEPRAEVCELVTDWLEQNVAQCSRPLNADSTTSEPTTTTIYMDRPYLIVVDGIESLDILDQPLLLPPNFLKYNEPLHERKSFRSYLLPEVVHSANWLFTTRSYAIAAALNTKRIELGNLSSSEAQSVCERILGDKAPADAGQMFADRLCTNPTVIALAVGYIRHTGISFTEYAEQISASLSSLTNHSPPIEFPVEFRGKITEAYAPNILVTAIWHTMHLLLKYNREEKTEGAITPFILWDIAKGFDGVHVPICWKINQLPDGGTVDEEHDALRVLLELSLIRRIKPGVFTVSDITLQGCWICFPTLREACMEDAQDAMLRFWRGWCPPIRGGKHPYLPLTEIVLSYPVSTCLFQAQLLEERAEYYLTLNFYREAWRDTLSAYQIYQELHNEQENSKSALNALHHLGKIAYDMGRHELAQKLHQSAFDGSQSLKNMDEFYFSCMSDLAMTLGRLGQYEASASLYRKAVDEREQIFGEDANVLLYKAYLGDQLCELGRVDEAFEILSQAYIGLKEKRGEGHRHTLTALSGIIDCLTRQQKWTEALEKRQYELKLTEERTGPNSRITLVTVCNLARLYYEVGDTAKSHKLFRRSIDGLMTKLGPKHPTTRHVRHNFKVLFRDRLVTV